MRRDLFPDHMLLDEVATVFGVHVNSVKAWISGETPVLPSVKFQGRRYVARDAVKALAAERGMEIRL